MAKFDASTFAPSMGMSRNLGQFGAFLGNQSYTPDLSSLTAVTDAFQNLPMMGVGGGQTLDLSSLFGAAQMFNPAAAGSLTQQGLNYGSNQLQLSDFLTNNAGAQQQMLATLIGLRAQQQQADNRANVGLLGAFL